jgi:hypothetical protein
MVKAANIESTVTSYKQNQETVSNYGNTVEGLITLLQNSDS